MYFLLLTSVLWIVLKCSASSWPYYIVVKKLLVNPGRTSAFSSSFFMLYLTVLFLWLIFIIIPRNKNLVGGVVFDALYFIDAESLF